MGANREHEIVRFPSEKTLVNKPVNIGKQDAPTHEIDARRQPEEADAPDGSDERPRRNAGVLTKSPLSGWADFLLSVPCLVPAPDNN